MDHLSQVSDPAFPPVEVPYICQEDYDGNGFTDYPLRKGWDKHRLLLGDFTEKPHTETASFLQAWLYFGMLHEVLGLPVQIGDFLRGGRQGHRFITTKAFPRYMDDWKNFVEHLPTDKRKERWVEVNTCLNEASSIMVFASWERKNMTRSFPLGPEICLSIMVLGASLDYAKNHVFNSEQPRMSWASSLRGPGNDEHFYWGTSEFTVSRMLNSGWCPNEVARLMDNLRPPGMFFASCLHRKPRGNHLPCSMDECVANQIDEDTYETKHTTEDCDCDHLAPDADKVKNILVNGGIPIIKLSAIPGSDIPRLDVIEGRQETGYVAISHVWSDGLGNPRVNSLPLCQLWRLKELISNLYSPERGARGTNWFSLPELDMSLIAAILNHEQPSDSSVLFWIDTLCVPLEGQLRKFAIKSMAKVYLLARNVLVLDAELQCVSIQLSTEECLIRLACSNWMKRLWTLQEGVIAENLRVQFEDGIFEPRNAIDSLDIGYSQTVPFEACAIYADLRWRDYVQNLTKPRRLAQAWKSFQWRSTSKKSDETICAGGLLEVDTMELSEIHPGERMKNLLSQLRVFPGGILFLRGSRIQEDGWRWALSSFGKRTGNIIDQSPAVLNNFGLAVTFPGYIFLAPEQNPGECFCFMDINDEKCYYACYLQDTDVEMPCWDKVSGRKDLRVGLIVEGAIKNSPRNAVLVSIYQEEQDILYTTFQCRMLIEAAGPRDLDSFRTHAQSLNRKGDIANAPVTTFSKETPILVSANGTKSDQKWYVG